MGDVTGEKQEIFDYRFISVDFFWQKSEAWSSTVYQSEYGNCLFLSLSLFPLVYSGSGIEEERKERGTLGNAVFLFGPVFGNTVQREHCISLTECSSLVQGHLEWDRYLDREGSKLERDKALLFGSPRETWSLHVILRETLGGLCTVLF